MDLPSILFLDFKSYILNVLITSSCNITAQQGGRRQLMIVDALISLCSRQPSQPVFLTLHLLYTPLRLRTPFSLNLP